MKTLIAIFIAFAFIVIALGVYLGPNDLGRCSTVPDETEACGKADAIITVSGGDTAARTTEAINLYRNGWASTLIFSGAAQDKTGPSNAEAMRRQAVAANVPESAIVTEEFSETTRQNAEQIQTLLSERGIKRIILVTSAYHQRRASLEFHKRTEGTVTILNHPVAQDNQWSRLWWLTPGGWWLAVGEFFKIVAFYLGGTR